MSTPDDNQGWLRAIQANDVVYGDILGCISQYFYEGWRYRLKQEGDEKIRKESNEAAHRMLDPFLGRRQEAIEKAITEARIDTVRKILTVKTEGLFDDGDLFIKRAPIEQAIVELIGYEAFKAIKEEAGTIDLSTLINPKKER